MAARKESDVLAVLAAAYILAYLIERFNFEPAVHFWFYSLQSLTLTFIIRNTKDKALVGYSLLCCLHLSLYVPLIVADYPLIILILWDANLSLSDIMLSYELAMLIFGGWRAAMAIYNGTVDVDSRGSAGHTHNNQGSKA